MDSNTNIETLKEKVREFVKARDWEQFHHPKELAISLNIEAAELLEVFQWKEKEKLDELKKNEKVMKEIEGELADVIIYSLCLANQTGIDVSKAVIEKLKKSDLKYPVEKFKGRFGRKDQL